VHISAGGKASLVLDARTAGRLDSWSAAFSSLDPPDEYVPVKRPLLGDPDAGAGQGRDQVSVISSSTLVKSFILTLRCIRGKRQERIDRELLSFIPDRSF
jgi:hypothetical protein